MFSKFSEEAQKVLLQSKEEMQSLSHPYVGSEHLLLAILKEEDEPLTRQLKSYNITYERFKKELIKVVGIGKNKSNWFLYTPLLKRVLETALLNAKEEKTEVTVQELFLSLLEEGEGVAIRLLMGMNIDIDELYNELSTHFVEKSSKYSKKLYIEEFSVDFNARVEVGNIDPVVGRDKEINRLIEILSRRTKNNPLLLGEAGVGKTAIVEELARRIVEGNVPDDLKNKRILSLSMANLISGTKYRGEFEERVEKMLQEVEASNEVIVFIDEIHTLVGAGGAEGAIDASNILKPALARGKLKLIGATTTEEYRTFIEKDKALDRRFQPVFIEEPSDTTTYQILKKLKPIYESFHSVKMSDAILKLIIHLSNQYIYTRYQPDKSIDLLDEVCARASLMENEEDEKKKELSKEIKNIIEKKKKAILKQDFEKASYYKQKELEAVHAKNKLELQSLKKKKPVQIKEEMVAEVVYMKTKIPVYELLPQEQKKLIQLSSILKSKVLGQDEIIDDLCKITKRVHFGFERDAKIHSFLFLGKTGLGKTYLVKEYAKMLYGKNSFFRLDMSEYKEAHTTSKIIGSPPGYVGYDDGSTLLEKVRKQPFCVILLDEIEKAHPAVLKLFLQILDEGVIKDAKGREVYFHHVFLFMTSNLDSRDTVGFLESDKKTLKELEAYVGVEFINRIGHIYHFKPLSEEVISKIIRKQLETLKRNYEKENITIEISTDIVEKILKNSNYQKFGARRVEKLIDDEIDHEILEAYYGGKKKIEL